ncbi:ladderlectin [Anabas testudineus]|uniref:ladderlectin n=1 Tax=Anabas testudineus TaxID=64144 RepID=UPI000E462E4F|nr:ladderlectin [Anabas testudineus]
MKFLTVCTILTLSRSVPVNCTLPRHAGLCEYERQMCSKVLGADFIRCGAFCPQCDADGYFLPKQCWGSTGYCWCVDTMTGCEIPNTRTPPGTEPNCGSESKCPDGWSHFGNKCYIFIDTPKRWIDAEVYCRFDGASLASIHSEQENHFISLLTRGESHNFPQTWLGGFDSIQPGFWMWSDGSEFSYKNWEDYEEYKKPDDDDEEKDGDDDLHSKKSGKKKHCLGINYKNDWKWFYTSCTESLPFICAKSI